MSESPLTRRQLLYLSGVGALGLTAFGQPISAQAVDDQEVLTGSSETEFVQQQKFAAEDGDNGDWFGDKVAISANGSTALISARKDEDPYGEASGSVYVYSRSDGQWAQQEKLTASDGNSEDEFGSSIALSADGTTALIGASRNDEPNGVDSGSAYVFTQTDGQWEQQEKLFAADGDNIDNFGGSVALSDKAKTALIGARYANKGTKQSAGAAYVFTRSSNQWTQQQKLTAGDGDEQDWFGGSVSLSGDGTTALIGAYQDEDANGEEAGSAYLFTQSDGQWIQQEKLTASDGDSGDLFGISVSLSTDGATALIGAVGDNEPNGESAGSAYVFRQNSGGWTQQEKIAPDDGDSWDRFAGPDSVSLSGDGGTALIGAHTDEDPNGQDAGSTYIFTLNDSQWTQDQKIAPNDGDDGDKFGIGVALSNEGTTALVGARKDKDPNGPGAGSAYVFESGSSKSDEPNNSVELHNPEITPEEVDGTNPTHTLTFKVTNLSADHASGIVGSADEFSIKLSENININEVSIIDAGNLTPKPENPSPENPITFTVNPSETTEAEMEVELSLSASGD